MQVSVETTSGLERRMTVEVPAARIEQEVKSRLKSLASKAKLDGFRPGKVPLSVVERRFSGQVRAEVLGDMIRASFDEALSQEKLRPAGGPKIQTLYQEPDKGLGYTATFEIYPEVTLAPLAELKIRRPSVEITEPDVERMIEKLRKQRQKWEPVERGAQLGDQLQVEFTMQVDGKEDTHGATAQQTTLILGESVIEKPIEDKIMGLKAGEEAVIEHTMPADFHDPAMAGKPVRYTIKVMALYQPVPPALDEEFIRSLGVPSGTLDDLRAEVRANMQRELEQVIRGQVKAQVMDALVAANPIELPAALVAKEMDILARQAQGRQPQAAAPDAAQLARHEPTARRRVTLGLLLGEILKTSGVQVDPARLRSYVETIASTYEDPAEVVKWYYGSTERLKQVESLVLEDQVVEWVAEQAQIESYPDSFDALMNPQHGRA